MIKVQFPMIIVHCALIIGLLVIVPALESSDTWPVFRGNPAADGLARCKLPAEPELLWTFSIEDGGFAIPTACGFAPWRKKGYPPAP